MEIISLNFVPQCSVVTWSGELATKRLVPNRSSLFLSGVRKSRFVIRNGNSDGYVVGENEDLGTISTRRRESSTSKVLIPGLPDESNGEAAARISHSHCEWRPKLRVHYEKSGCGNVEAPPVLFLPGFGVGSFHYEKQLTDLGRDYRVWAIDFLGQGLSLPTEDPTTTVAEETGASEDDEKPFWGFGDKTEPWADQLVFSLDLWRDQVQYFVEEVIGEPVYIAGNSLGGYVALYFAATHPHLVKGVTLLNATPFWGFFPNPVRSPKLARLFPWPGAFPLPARVKKITELVWQKISDPESIAEILKQVYTDHSTNVDKVFSRIVEITQHPAAAASFASIMLAPGGQLSFSEALSRCKENSVQICLMYGREDPWVSPMWGKKIKKEIPNAPYYEISPAGHCPHDEVPEVVNYLMRGWIKHLESGGFEALPLLDDSEENWEESSIGREIEFPRDGWKKAVKLLLYGPNNTFWSGVRASFKSSFTRVFGGKSA